MILQLEINKKQYPIRVSYYALKHAQLELKRPIEFTREDGMTDYEGYEAVLYHSLIKGWKTEQKEGEMPFKREEMEEIMDVVWQEFNEVVAFFFPPKEEDKKEGTKTGKKN